MCCTSSHLSRSALQTPAVSHAQDRVTLPQPRVPRSRYSCVRQTRRRLSDRSPLPVSPGERVFGSLFGNEFAASRKLIGDFVRRPLAQRPARTTLRCARVSRVATHDSRSGWLAMSFQYGSFDPLLHADLSRSTQQTAKRFQTEEPCRDEFKADTRYSLTFSAAPPRTPTQHRMKTPPTSRYG